VRDLCLLLRFVHSCILGAIAWSRLDNSLRTTLTLVAPYQRHPRITALCSPLASHTCATSSTTINSQNSKNNTQKQHKTNSTPHPTPPRTGAPLSTPSQPPWAVRLPRYAVIESRISLDQTSIARLRMPIVYGNLHSPTIHIMGESYCRERIRRTRVEPADCPSRRFPNSAASESITEQLGKRVVQLDRVILQIQ